MYLNNKVLVIMCLWNPKTLVGFKIKFKVQIFKFLCIVDQMFQSAIFENFMKSN
jgi:hypothetical protein